MMATGSDEQLRRPRLILEARPACQTGEDVRAGVRAINGFWRLMGELAGNPALALFIHTAQAYGAKASGLNMTAPRQRAYFASLREICAAIEGRDPERAVRLNAARTEQMLGWAREDEDYARGQRAPPRSRKRVAASPG
jgi:DNA-binding GntR family transcriptional regulator